MNLKPPNINAPTTAGQIKQITEYLFMITMELNHKFSILENEQKKGDK